MITNMYYFYHKHVIYISFIISTCDVDVEQYLKWLYSLILVGHK